MPFHPIWSRSESARTREDPLPGSPPRFHYRIDELRSMPARVREAACAASTIDAAIWGESPRKEEIAVQEKRGYFPTGNKTGAWTEIWRNEAGIQIKVTALESGVPYRVVPMDGTPAFHLTMEEYTTAYKEGITF